MRCRGRLLPAVVATGLLLAILPQTVLDAQVRRGASRQTARHELIQRKRDDEQRRFAADLEQIAEFCERHDQPHAAAEIRSLARQTGADGMTVRTLPDREQPAIPLDLPAVEREWRTRLRSARDEHAEKLYLLSREFLNAGLPSSAYQLVRETAAWNPDHPLARKLLGFKRYRDEWVTPFAALQLGRGNVWHDQFGWLPKEHVARYEQGERFYRGWKPAEQEAAIRRDFRHAWEVETEHFLIRTNHSLERGVEIARALEDYYEFFYQTFAGFFQSPEQMQRLFQELSTGARGGTLPTRKHVFHYYRAQDEYIAALREKIPQIRVTDGVYYPPDRVAYFYHDPERENNATLYHEACHQFFYESSKHDRPVGEEGHFWIVEGIACYMESYDRDGESISLGDPRFIRFYWARRRLLAENYFIPLDRFSALTMREFQSAVDQRELQQRYSQASGLAHFLMHYEGGRYREALVDYLSQIYRGDPRRPVRSLSDLTGTPSAELDAQYQDYIHAMDQAVGPDDRAR
ncbi:MAG TPA: hypothetical protein VML55_03145 [Planctomycetaceae bacterium]|nr:hypothetical protein [Planctomycetaceae bacterium]